MPKIVWKVSARVSQTLLTTFTTFPLFSFLLVLVMSYASPNLAHYVWPPQQIIWISVKNLTKRLNRLNKPRLKTGIFLFPSKLFRMIFFVEAFGFAFQQGRGNIARLQYKRVEGGG